MKYTVKSNNLNIEIVSLGVLQPGDWFAFLDVNRTRIYVVVEKAENYNRVLYRDLEKLIDVYSYCSWKDSNIKVRKLTSVEIKYW